MTLTCPHCGFSRDLAADRIPSRATRAACPRCRATFPLVPVEGAARSESLPGPPEATEVHYPSPSALPKAGFWIRLVAWLVDSTVITVVQIVLGLTLAAVGLNAELDPSGQRMIAMVTWLFGSTLTVAYYVFFTGYCGQTPGKMALRIKVIGTDGAEIGYRRAALREVLGKFVSGILLGIGYLMIAFDPQKQGLHDKMADTYVIKL